MSTPLSQKTVFLVEGDEPNPLSLFMQRYCPAYLLFAFESSRDLLQYVRETAHQPDLIVFNTKALAPTDQGAINWLRALPRLDQVPVLFASTKRRPFRFTCRDAGFSTSSYAR